MLLLWVADVKMMSIPSGSKMSLVEDKFEIHGVHWFLLQHETILFWVQHETHRNLGWHQTNEQQKWQSNEATGALSSRVNGDSTSLNLCGAIEMSNG